MSRRNNRALAILAIMLLPLTITYAKQVAITIDDLPYVGNAGNNEGKLRREKQRFEMILKTLEEEKVPATGFVVAGYIEKDQWSLLEAFHQQGNIIGNHTYSHRGLGRSSAEQFIEDIDKADEIIAPLMSTPKYFRYPFLSMGRQCKTKAAVRQHLYEKGYWVAPVTIDPKDYNMNQRWHNVPWRQRDSVTNSFRQRYLSALKYRIHQAENKAMQKMHRPIKHILLIHMNTLNAMFFKDVIQLFRDEGYEFITLPDALSDPYYEIYTTRLMEPNCEDQTS
ncbi:MAG: polysaccharide deacetylase family protein [Coxiellaceae bacterium]|nr:polysaccharide deacetylase family protein [Coxiellaceae bacterium]